MDRALPVEGARRHRIFADDRIDRAARDVLVSGRMRFHLLLGFSVFGAVFVACGGKALDKEIWLSDPTASAPTAKADIPPPTDDTPAKTTPTAKPASCAVSYERDVLVVLKTCAGNSCHTNLIDPFIDTSEPDKTYDALTSYRIGKMLFVDPSSKNPETSAMLCNFRGDEGCGIKMPLGGNLSGEELETIETWLACGAPR